MTLNPDRGFVPERVAGAFDYADRLTAGTGTTIAREYASCPHCETLLNGAINGGREEDRDVVFENITCPHCENSCDILVEEKVWGFGTDPDATGVVGDVFELVDDRVFFLNPSRVYVTPN